MALGLGTVRKTAGAESSDSPQRRRILDLALSLMAQQGVDGTSMRDLANAAGLNVATLYHYFPSKADLLTAVLTERGYEDLLEAPSATSSNEPKAAGLKELIDDQLRSMLDLEDFVRLMLGEALRGDPTALAVGTELLNATQAAFERWLEDCEPELSSELGAGPLSRLLRALLVGLFVEHAAGIIRGEPDDPFAGRASEIAAILSARSPVRPI
ncbi:MAG: TetR/AcrR family transcriptional regulator [Actinobacteria bacterium]|nr:TetR/AcrR family transcriptional regulator [Actinomycetota bacterium]